MSLPAVADRRVARCDVCGSTRRGREHRRRDGSRVVECAGCGVGSLDPLPSTGELATLYGREYFDGSRAGRGEGGLCCGRGAGPERLADIGSTVALLERKCGGLAGKRLLEVGCAYGELLQWLTAAGAVGRGMDISEHAAEAARLRGLDVHAGTIEEEAAQRPRSCDILVAEEVIEHVPSPADFIAAAARLLTSPGWLYLTTPNFFLARRFEDDWLGFQTSFEHLHFFTLDSLERAAGSHGLRLVHWETSAAPGGTLGDRRRLSDMRWVAPYLGFLVRRRGARGALAVLRRRDHYRQGLGHTIRALFEKAPELRERA